MGGIENSNPAEVYEQYLGRLIADPFTRLLLGSNMRHRSAVRGFSI
jgi:hypothetical protein